MLRYAKRTNTSEMKAFCCAVLILCLTTGHAMPQIAGSLCDSTSLHDTLCAPLRIGKKKYFRQTFRRCLIPLRPPAPSYPHRNTRRERLYPPPPPSVFVKLPQFLTIIDSLLCRLQDDVNLIGYICK